MIFETFFAPKASIDRVRKWVTKFRECDPPAQPVTTSCMTASAAPDSERMRLRGMASIEETLDIEEVEEIADDDVEEIQDV